MLNVAVPGRPVATGTSTRPVGPSNVKVALLLPLRVSVSASPGFMRTALADEVHVNTPPEIDGSKCTMDGLAAADTGAGIARRPAMVNEAAARKAIGRCMRSPLIKKTPDQIAA